jgi:hypothetical protein
MNSVETSLIAPYTTKKPPINWIVAPNSSSVGLSGKIWDKESTNVTWSTRTIRPRKKNNNPTMKNTDHSEGFFKIHSSASLTH